MTRAETFMNEDGSRLMSDIRMKPMGGGHDHVEQLAWVPTAWKARSLTPEALRSLGTPWLLSHVVAGARKDGVQWPLAGFGHFLCVQRGDMLTCLIPGTAIVDRGATLETCDILDTVVMERVRQVHDQALRFRHAHSGACSVGAIRLALHTCVTYYFQPQPRAPHSVCQRTHAIGMSFEGRSHFIREEFHA